jgi:small-conductance mechanosensitive channel
LIAAIEANDGKHKVASSHKKQILLDALEEVASVSPECRGPLMSVLRQFRPSEEAPRRIFRTSLTSDASLKSEIIDCADRKAQLSERVARLRAEINTVEAKTAQFRADVDVMKEKVLNENQHLLHSRELFIQMRDLNKQFGDLFVHPPEREEPEFRKRLLEEKEELIRTVATKKNELDILKQLTRKVAFMDANPERQTGDE